MKEVRPEVSVCITTYYHEKYIHEALESVLSQNVNFPYEIVISDDCSKDSTQTIINEYKKKYKFIKVNYNKKNIGLTKNVFLARTLCKGKYIASLSGDDYWIDNNKMQKQYEFLESHPDYFAVACRATIKDGSTSKEKIVPKINETQKDYTLEMFLKGNNLCMNGIMIKNVYRNKNDRKQFEIMPKISNYIDDLTDNLLFAKYGKIYVQDYVFSVYRYRTNEKNFNSINKGLSSYKKHIELLNNLNNYFHEEYDLFYRYRLIVLNGIKQAIIQRNIDEFYMIYKTVPSNYRKRFLLLSSFLLIPKKIINKL